MAKIHLATFRQVVAEHRFGLEGKDLNDWQSLRREINGFQDDVRAFSRYVKREFNDPNFRRNLEETREDQEDLCAEAQALESLLRDRLQLSASIESLKESR